MSEIEALIEEMENMDLWTLGDRLSKDKRLIEKIQSFLHTLHPHDNQELVEGMNKYIGDVGTTVTVSPTSKAILNKVIAALGRPLPFDILSSFERGLEFVNSHGQTFRRVGNMWFFGVIGDDFLNCNETAYHNLLNALIIGDLKPYTRPEPEIEDGLYFVSKDGNNQKLPFLLEKKRWKGIENSGHQSNSDLLCGVIPRINPDTNKPWRIYTPEDT